MVDLKGCFPLSRFQLGLVSCPLDGPSAPVISFSFSFFWCGYRCFHDISKIVSLRYVQNCWKPSLTRTAFLHIFSYTTYSSVQWIWRKNPNFMAISPFQWVVWRNRRRLVFFATCRSETVRRGLKITLRRVLLWDTYHRTQGWMHWSCEYGDECQDRNLQGVSQWVTIRYKLRPYVLMKFVILVIAYQISHMQ